MLRCVLPFVLLFAGLPGHAQLVLDGTRSPQELVQEVLVGQGITVSNVIFNDAPGSIVRDQIGFFDATECVLGIDSGLFMCTGGIQLALGPNDQEGASLDPDYDLIEDPDLESVAEEGFTFDPAILEFDFVPLGDTIRFEYVFASEEYLEYVGTVYNDVFGFFLSGPGISGPFTNDAINLAIVPGTSSPVSVNTINDATNSAYYVDNGDGFTAPYADSPIYVQFDGYTLTLVAKAVVQCGQTYHIKLAICDVGDPDLDSGIFLRQGTLTSVGGEGIVISTSSGSSNVVEGCDNAVITVVRASGEGEQTMPITVSGSATSGLDVGGIPANAVFADGQTSVSFPITFTTDGIAEGPEPLTLSVEVTGPCQGLATATVTIADALPIEVTAEDVQGQCDSTDVTLEAVATGGNGGLEYLWSSGSTQPATNVPDHSGSYTVTVTDECGVSATATVEVIAPCDIIVPNVFTPNDDGSNDVFKIPGIEFTRNHVRIFNRWGMPVFEAANYRNTWRASGIPDGTYFYEVMTEGLDRPLTGHLTILDNRR